ncbi:MAG TPA: MFS transporter [Xanthomonadaceae bacterium]|nr:MFS transporter [Xanthomonadaceae bacterium]
MPLPDNLAARRASAVGFGAALVSAAGQTFFIGLFGAEFQQALALDAAQLGGLYALATLASGVLMFWLGASADHLRLGHALTLALVILAAGALTVAAAFHPGVLLVGLFLLRLGGQGLAGHFAIVAAARFGGLRAGRGLSVVAFGFILGEGLFPFLVIAALGALPWRAVWLLVLAAILLALLALRRGSAPFPAPVDDVHGPDPDMRRLGRRRLLRSPVFLAALSVVLVSAFVVTAIFLHLGTLTAHLDWPRQDLPMAFLCFAAAQALSNVACGVWVDRVGVLAVTRFYLWPLAAALVAMVLLPGPVGLMLGFAGLGLTAGGQGVVGGALWLTLFGPARLGLVRGVYAAMMVFATAVSPWLLGRALASEVSLHVLALTFAAYAIVAPLAVVGLLRRARGNGT